MVPDLDSQAQSGYSLHGTLLPLVDLRVVLGPTSVLPFSAAALISWPAYLVDRCLRAIGDDQSSNHLRSALLIAGGIGHGLLLLLSLYGGVINGSCLDALVLSI